MPRTSLEVRSVGPDEVADHPRTLALLSRMFRTDPEPFNSFAF